jgi:uncharacterized protein (TIGR03437 family)
MKKYNLNLCIAIVAGVSVFLSLFTGCSKSNSNPAPANNSSSLSISSLSKSSGPYTTTVIITGTGFSTTVANDKVFFNGVAAVVQQASSTQIETTVPLAAGSGAVTVTVNGKTATGPVFSYQATEVAVLFGQNQDGTAASFSQIDGLAADASGNVYVADQQKNLISKITPQGIVSVFAGSGGAGSTDANGTSASFKQPSGVATDAAGNVYVADKGNGLVRKITPAGDVSTITLTNSDPTQKGFGQPFYVTVDANNNVFFMDLGGTVIKQVSGTGTVTAAYTGAVGSSGFYGVVVDKSGNFFTVDNSDNQIDKISSGSISVFAGANSLTGGDMDGIGKAASFYQPWGMAIDGSGNLFVLDRGNNQIREVTSGAVVTTFGGQNPQLPYVGPVNMVGFVGLTAITVDSSGNIYITDGQQIRKISVQ